MRGPSLLPKKKFAIGHIVDSIGKVTSEKKVGDTPFKEQYLFVKFLQE